MLLTKDETISELKNEKSYSDHILYEANGCGFHAAKLLSIEPYFVETKEKNDVGFTKSLMKGFFRLKFQENDNVKTYEVDVNPEVANKVYYYITKDGRITHLFPNKEDIIAYATQTFAESNKSNENDSQDSSMLLLMVIPVMLLPLSAMLYSIPLFFKLALSLTWIASFITFFFSSPSKQNNNHKYKDKEAKLQSFIKQVKNFEE